jgi:hypothetical protein
MTLMRFKIGGPGGEHELVYDWAQDLTGADIWWLEEMGLTPRVLEEVIEKAHTIAAGEDRGLVNGLGLKALCAIAYVAYRRGGGEKPWINFAAGVTPRTFEVLEMVEPPPNRPKRRSGARPATKTATVGDALVDAGAAAPTD